MDLADFDGNGTPDLALLSHSRLFVASGKGDGTFLPATAYYCPESARFLKSVDFNADGLPDIAIALGSLASHPIALYQNNGDGTFELTLPDYPIAHLTLDELELETGDFNGDGKKDLVLCNKTEKMIRILLSSNSQPGTLSSPFPTSPALKKLAIGDLTGDGFDELIQVQEYSNSVLVNLGGIFAAPISAPSGYSGLAALADFDGDGKAEVADFNNKIYRWEDGHFSELASTKIQGFSSAQVADLNGDKKPDLITTSFFSNNVITYINKGNFVFEPSQTFPQDPSSSPFLLADINNDQQPDLLTLSGFVLHRELNKGDGTFPFPLYLPALVATTPMHFVLADLNKDGRQDILASYTGWLSVWLTKGIGSFEPEARYELPNGYPTAPAIGDIDLDGIADVVIGTSQTAPMLMRGISNGKLLKPESLSSDGSSWGLHSIVLANLNLDQKPDIVFGSQNGIFVMINLGGNSFAKNVVAYGTLRAVQDINGDGSVDIVAEATGPFILVNDGSGWFPKKIQFDDHLYSASYADMDHDGLPEMVLPGGDIRKNLGGLNFGLPVALSSPVALDSFRLINLNGDSWPDALVSSDSGTILVINNGKGGMVNPAYFASHFTIGDIDGDGNQDLVRQRGTAVQVLFGACL